MIPTLTPPVVLNDCWRAEHGRARLSLGNHQGFLTVLPEDGGIDALPDD